MHEGDFAINLMNGQKRTQNRVGGTRGLKDNNN